MTMKWCSIAPSIWRHRNIVIVSLHHHAIDYSTYSLFAHDYRTITIVSTHYRVLAPSHHGVIVIASSATYYRTIVVAVINTVSCHRSIDLNFDGAIVNHMALSGFRIKRYSTNQPWTYFSMHIYSTFYQCTSIQACYIFLTRINFVSV